MISAGIAGSQSPEPRRLLGDGSEMEIFLMMLPYLDKDSNWFIGKFDPAAFFHRMTWYITMMTTTRGRRSTRP
jgi:hypothetical protein